MVWTTTYETNSQGLRFSVDHYQYVDGLGDALETFDQVGTQSNSQYVVSGLHQRYANGLVSQVSQPFFAIQGIVPTHEWKRIGASRCASSF